jgi:hypothetical protein
MMKSSRSVGPRDPSMEPYYGRAKTNDFIVGNLPFIGQAAPLVRERMRSYHGRYMSGVEGFSGDSVDGAVGTDPVYESEALDELESQDDVFGSGIFDQVGRGPTSNQSMGVFASHYALPGFVAREVPFTVSKDITDITDNADVVMVPGGGMTFAEVRGQMVPPSRRLGEPVRGPGLRVSGPTTRAQVYKSLEGLGDTYPNRPLAPQQYWESPVQEYPVQSMMPFQTRERGLRQSSIVTPRDAVVAVGASESESSPGKMALWGVLIGAAVGGVVVLVKNNKNR